MASSRRDALAVEPGHTWMVKAWKWGAGSLSAGAAPVSILSSGRSITGAHQGPRIGVAPAAATAWADGATEGGVTRLVAGVVDARRHPVPGQSIAWRSADPSVVSVDSAARLSAVPSGRAPLVASSGDLPAELPLEVYPVPATITLLAGD